MKKRGSCRSIYKNKTAQFYLIAAVIIVIMIIGLASVSNYVVTKDKPTRFYDLSEELNEESYRVSEFIIVNEQDVMQDFTGKVAGYIEEDVDNFAVFYGDKDGAKLEFYTKEDPGGVSVTIGEGEEAPSFIVSGRKEFVSDSTQIPPEELSGEESIAIELLGESYNFELSEGQNFIFIITKNAEEEKHIATTES